MCPQGGETLSGQTWTRARVVYERRSSNSPSIKPEEKKQESTAGHQAAVSSV